VRARNATRNATSRRPNAPGWRAVATFFVVLLAGCGRPIGSPGMDAPSAGTAAPGGSPGPMTPPTSTVGPTATPGLAVSGAQLLVQVKGTGACEGGFVCTARLAVLPDGTEVDEHAVAPSAAVAVWQSDSWLDGNLVAPPDGDLPVLAPGGHVVVWSVEAQQMVTDGPGVPPVLASRCSTRVVVDPGAAAVTVRVRFAGGSAVGSGSSACTLRQVPAIGATAVPSPAGITGVAPLPAAVLPAAWRRVPTTNLDDLGDPGFRIALGVAPDGAFIAIPSGGDRVSLPVLRSANGEVWTKVAVLPGSKDGWTHAVAWNDQVIVVTGGKDGGAGPMTWVSADGIAWTTVDAEHADGLGAVDSLAANSAGFVATGLGTSGVAPWVGSADGVEWRRVGSLTATLDAGMVDVIASGSGFVGVGGQRGTAAAWVSPDGVTWTPATVDGGAGVSLVSVAALGEHLVAFGQGADPRGDPLLFASFDGGRTWAPAADGTRPQSSWPQVLAVADGFLATDYGVWTSRDGATWDDAAWSVSVGDGAAGGVPSVAASGSRIVAAAMPDGGGSPRFWIGEAAAP